MKCPDCGQSVPDIAARCPHCQAELEGGLVGTLPPRASQRDFSTNASIRISKFFRDAARLLGSSPAPDRFFSPWLESVLASPELFISIAFPGAGHVYLGRIFIGTGLFAVTVASLVGLFSLYFNELPVDTDPSLMLFGTFLGVVHLSAWAIGARTRNLSRSTVSRPAAVLIIMVGITFQFYLVNHLLEYSLGYSPTQVYIRGAAFWAPTLLPGDRLVIASVPASDIQPGDLLMISNTLCERALGLSSDVVTTSAGMVFRNGRPLLGTDTRPLMPLNSPFVPEQVIGVVAIPEQRIVVPPGHVAYLSWGRELRTIPVSGISGRIDGIIAPIERRCRFEHGRPIPLAPGLIQTILGL